MCDQEHNVSADLLMMVAGLCKEDFWQNSFETAVRVDMALLL